MDILPPLPIKAQDGVLKYNDHQEPFSYSVQDGWFIRDAKFFEEYRVGNAGIKFWRLDGSSKILDWSQIHQAYDHAQTVLQQTLNTAPAHIKVHEKEIRSILENKRQQHIAARSKASKTGFSMLSYVLYAEGSWRKPVSEIRGYPVVTIQYVGHDLEHIKQVLAQFVQNEIAKRTRQIHSSKME